MDRIKLNSKFASYAEFNKCMEAYEKANNVVYITHDCRRLKDNDVLVYKSLVKACKHFGTKKKNPKNLNVRVKQRSFKINCGAYIKLKAIKNFLFIISINETHNHVVDKDIVLHYPERRRLSLDEVKKQNLDDLLAMKVPTNRLVDHIHKTTGKFLTTKDICNLRYSVMGDKESSKHAKKRKKLESTPADSEAESFPQKSSEEPADMTVCSIKPSADKAEQPNTAPIQPEGSARFREHVVRNSNSPKPVGNFIENSGFEHFLEVVLLE